MKRQDEKKQTPRSTDTKEFYIEAQLLKRVRSAIEKAYEEYLKDKTGRFDMDGRVDDLKDIRRSVSLWKDDSIIQGGIILKEDAHKVQLHLLMPLDFSRNLLIEHFNKELGCALSKEDCGNIEMGAGNGAQRYLKIPLDKIITQRAIEKTGRVAGN